MSLRMDRPLTIIGSYVSPYVRKVLAAMKLKGGIGFKAGAPEASERYNPPRGVGSESEL